MAVFDLISPPLPERQSISKFQQLLITFMRLRLNLSVQDLADRFGVCASTVLRVFQTCKHVMFTSMAFLVKWPGRERGTENDITNLLQREVFFMCCHY